MFRFRHWWIQTKRLDMSTTRFFRTALDQFWWRQRTAKKHCAYHRCLTGGHGDRFSGLKPGAFSIAFNTSKWSKGRSRYHTWSIWVFGHLVPYTFVGLDHRSWFLNNFTKDGVELQGVWWKFNPGITYLGRCQNQQILRATFWGSCGSNPNMESETTSSAQSLGIIYHQLVAGWKPLSKH